ncbi:MAG TPA: helix-turn-helix domain-containing protein [Abditibacterium sp.]|jgi:AraC-like DNA-binding protein
MPIPVSQREFDGSIVWQSRQHFDLSDPWEQVEFAVYAAFDVVARPGWRIAFPRQQWNELWLVRSGEVEIEQNGESRLARSPCVVLLHGGLSRDTRQIGEEPLSIVGFAFGATLWGALDFLDFVSLQPVWPCPASRFESTMSRMVEEATARESGYSLAIQGLGQLALVEIWRAQGQFSADARGALQIAQSGELQGALQLVASHFDRPLSVDDMARAALLSTKHFGRKFHSALGITPMEYVRRVRLGRARALLASSDESVGHIARRCGFESAAHFSRAFRAHYSASPLQFRRDLRAMTRANN